MSCASLKTGSIPILSLTASRKSLFTTDIFFRGLHRDVAQQKLNLFQFAPGVVAEAGTQSSKVMGREFYDSHLACVLLYDMPDHLFGHFGAQTVPVLQTHRNNRPWATLDATSQSSTVRLTHEGTGIVRT